LHQLQRIAFIRRTTKEENFITKIRGKIVLIGLGLGMKKTGEISQFSERKAERFLRGSLRGRANFQGIMYKVTRKLILSGPDPINP
jgi:hypothetical protein